jgi:hypothetical protein
MRESKVYLILGKEVVKSRQRHAINSVTSSVLEVKGYIVFVPVDKDQQGHNGFLMRKASRDKLGTSRFRLQIFTPIAKELSTTA